MKTLECPHCGGKGYRNIISFTHHAEMRNYKDLCVLCLGDREIDWITNITKKPTTTNAMCLMRDDLVYKYGNYTFKLITSSKFFIKKEFSSVTFKDRWDNVILCMDNHKWRVVESEEIDE